MSKKNLQKNEVVNEVVVVETEQVVESRTEKLFAKLGRPVEPGSKRQMRLLEMKKRSENGEVKLGRPANPESKHYQQKLEMQRRREAGEIGSKGRPATPESKHYKEKLAKLERPRQREEAAARFKMMESAGE